jgi:hypothetical protein
MGKARTHSKSCEEWLQKAGGQLFPREQEDWSGLTGSSGISTVQQKNHETASFRCWSSVEGMYSCHPLDVHQSFLEKANVLCRNLRDTLEGDMGF